MPRWFAWAAGLALAGYAVFLGVHMTVVAGGSDSSGYLNSARLFAAGEWRTALRVPPEFGPAAAVDRGHFSPQGYNFFGDHLELAPTYPPGLPLHFALAVKILGWNVGPFLVQLLAAVGAIWLLYVTARSLGVGYELAAAGAVALAACPVFIFTSIQTLSDTLATTWTLLALLTGVRAREARGWALAGGAALATAVLVRPTNILLAPALIVLLGWDPRRLGLFVLGGVPGAGWLAYHNHQLYGGMLRSGYGDIFAAFGVGFGLPTAIHFAKWLALLLPAALLVLPLGALGRRGFPLRVVLALGLAAGAIIGLYLFYGVSHDVWWCLRFILPAVAALILAGVLGAETLLQRLGSFGSRWLHRRAALLLMAWAAALSVYWTRALHVLYVPEYERAYETMANEVNARLPANAVVVCSVFSGALYYYTNLPALVYDSLSPEQFARYAELARRGGRPLYAVIFDIEEEDVLRRRCPGPWVRVAAVRNIGIWQLGPGAP